MNNSIVLQFGSTNKLVRVSENHLFFTEHLQTLTKGEGME